jgi:hypothetical protein
MIAVGCHSCGGEYTVLHERQHRGRKRVQNIGECVENGAQCNVRRRSERRAAFVTFASEVARMKSSCVHLLSDMIKASSAPCVLGGSDRAKLVSKCNKAEQCRPLNRV